MALNELKSNMHVQKKMRAQIFVRIRAQHSGAYDCTFSHAFYIHVKGTYISKSIYVL